MIATIATPNPFYIWLRGRRPGLFVGTRPYLEGATRRVRLSNSTESRLPPTATWAAEKSSTTRQLVKADARGGCRLWLSRFATDILSEPARPPEEWCLSLENWQDRSDVSCLSTNVVLFSGWRSASRFSSRPALSNASRRLTVQVVADGGDPGVPYPSYRHLSRLPNRRSNLLSA